MVDAVSSSMISGLSWQSGLLIIGAILVIVWLWLLFHRTDLALQSAHMFFLGLFRILSGIFTGIWYVVSAIGRKFGGRR